MSRDRATKSRLDKSLKVQPTAPTPSVNEIIPGKLNETDWLILQDADDGDVFVYDFVREVLTKSFTEAFDRYIARQLIPFTVDRCRSSLEQIIEWEFLTKDPGEWDIRNDSSWCPDEEPAVSVFDCWAEGCIPRKPTSSDDVPPWQMSRSSTPAGDSGKVSAMSEGQADPVELDDSALSNALRQVQTENAPLPADFVPVKPASTLARGGSSGKFHRIRMKMQQREEEEKAQPDAVSRQPTNLPSFKKALLKQQSGRPPGDKLVEYDEHGNVIRIAPMAPSSLPTHIIGTKYTVIDPVMEREQRNLEAMRHGKTMMKPTRSNSYQKLQHMEQFERGLHNARVTYVKGPRIMKLPTDKQANPLPSPLFDKCHVSPGVVVYEGDRVKKGPTARPKRSQMLPSDADLRRVTQAVASRPRLHVSDLLDDNSLVVRSSQPIH